MERKVRVAQYGAGRMSRWLMRYVLEHEGELVAAFCRNPSHIGRDVSEIIGNDYPFVGVAVQPAADAEKVLADVAGVAAEGRYQLALVLQNIAHEPAAHPSCSILCNSYFTFH